MRLLCAALLGVGLTLPLWANEAAQPNTLTREEVAEGWLLLFDGTTPFGWQYDGKVNVTNGALVFQGEKTAEAATTGFLNFEVHFEYRIHKGSKDTPVRLMRDTVTTLPLTMYDDWASAKFTFDGHHGSGSIATKDSGEEQFQINSTGDRLEPFSLRFEIPKGVQLSLRNIKLRPLKMNPLFNGKNLEGWKKFNADPKRAKSEFAVKDEALSIHNGPGDLQTIGQWADFVLQLDCRTNGDNLNSGVFFRCIPGEYQNGYEAQIQNQAAKEPKSYTIEEYDPETHASKGKKKIDNWSQDYGTGAIYRRIPARRSIAKDREWFKLTVVAHGRHFATWVNGIQVVDWTDNRPERDNARNGCRLKKGAISLQGHDPTTDLNFRNFRLGSWDEKK